MSDFLDPSEVGNVVGDYERPIGSRISNYNAMARGRKLSQDRTRSSFADHDKQLNPERVITDAFLAHGTDWAEFEYNPYGHDKDSGNFHNPNRRRLSDNWSSVMGMGEILRVDFDIVGSGDDDAVSSGQVQYKNYPDEGWSSFGKKYDKQWKWFGNSWVPAA